MALVVVTGGARSGKSTAAQRVARARESDGARVCVAVFGRDLPADDEFAARVARHRAERPAAWSVVEAPGPDPDRWLSGIPEDELLVVDCLGTLLGQCMEEAYRLACDAELAEADEYALPDGFEASVSARFDSAVTALTRRPGDTIVVTNEVGDGIVPVYAAGRLFRDLLGSANRRLVSIADAAYLCVAGRLIDLKELKEEIAWPQD